MPPLEVDSERLRRIAREFEVVVEQLRGRWPAAPLTRAAGAVPDLAVAGGLRRCAGRCRELDDLLTDAARELARELETAAQLYEATDVLLARPPDSAPSTSRRGGGGAFDDRPGRPGAAA